MVIKSLQCELLAKSYSGDNNKQNKIGRAYSTYGRESEQKKELEEGINRIVILKLILNTQVGFN